MPRTSVRCSICGHDDRYYLDGRCRHCAQQRERQAKRAREARRQLRALITEISEFLDGDPQIPDTAHGADPAVAHLDDCSRALRRAIGSLGEAFTEADKASQNYEQQRETRVAEQRQARLLTVDGGAS